MGLGPIYALCRGHLVLSIIKHIVIPIGMTAAREPPGVGYFGKFLGEPAG